METNTTRVELAGNVRVLVFAKAHNPPDHPERQRLLLAWNCRPDRRSDGRLAPGVVLIMLQPAGFPHGAGHFPSFEEAIACVRRLARVLTPAFEVFVEPAEFSDKIDGALRPLEDDKSLHDAAHYFFASRLPRSGARDIDGRLIAAGKRCPVCARGWCAAALAIDFTGLWSESGLDAPSRHRVAAEDEIVQECPACRRSPEVN